MSALDAILSRLADLGDELDGRVSELERLEHFGSGGLPGLAHMLLDGGTVHSDTAVASPLRGAIVYGNASPVWDALPLGAAATFLRSDGTDLAWSAIQDGDLPATIARDSELHDPITLEATLAANLLGLTVQELALNTQVANLVFAGPVSGAAAAPAFRALVDTDIPTHVLATTSGLGSQHSVSGLTAGQVLKATGATTALFVQLLHSELGSIGANDHHNQSHVLADTSALGGDHTVSGLTAGMVLRATGATTAAFQAIQAGDLPSHTHDHSTLTNVTANQHHNQSHVLATTSALGADHTVAGLTEGFVLVATGATTAVFAQLLHSQLGSIGANDHHNQSHVLATTSALGPDHTVSGLTARQFLVATGATTALFRAIEDADIPASIARDSELHDAVTLSTTLNNNLLSLSTQELGLDNQAANLVFAGPTTGAAAAPTFRSAVVADLPVGSAQYQFLMTGATPFAPVYTAVSTLAGAGMTATAGVLNVIAADTSMTINADSIQVRLAATSGLQISTGLMIADTVAGAGLTIASKVLAVNVSGLGLSVTTDTVVLTSSSNPGAAAAIIASSSSGGVQLTRFGINTTPTTNGAIDISNGGWIGLSSSTARLSFNIATENYLSMDAANLVINQGAYDGALLTGISSDVAHGMTTLAGTDVYVELAKLSPTAGGLIVEGYTEDVWGVFIRANSTNGDTAKSTAATGAIGASASKKSGMGRADMGANENLFTIRNNATTRWIVDAEGDTHRDGTDNTFDQYNDALLARAFDLSVSPGSVIDSKFDTWVEYERADLIAAGILHQSGFYNESRLLRLAIGAVWQMYVHQQLLEQHVLELEQKLLS